MLGYFWGVTVDFWNHRNTLLVLSWMLTGHLIVTHVHVLCSCSLFTKLLEIGGIRNQNNDRIMALFCFRSSPFLKIPDWEFILQSHNLQKQSVQVWSWLETHVKANRWWRENYDGVLTTLCLYLRSDGNLPLHRSTTCSTKRKSKMIWKQWAAGGRSHHKSG